jgi:metal-responsive CopG/Arc/MetJ family transcriptional regulator
MGLQRAHIVLPEELIAEIDSLVGPRGRSAFLVETARAELRRRRLLAFLHSDQPAWHEPHHPELATGTATWVRKLRHESEGRIARTKRTGTPSK